MGMTTLEKMDTQFLNCLNKWKSAEGLLISQNSKNLLRDRRKLQKEYDDLLSKWNKEKQRLVYEME